MKKHKLVILLCILGFGIFFRFFRLADTPPGLYPDEAMNGNNALEALATMDFKVFYPENNGREGLFINVQAISLAFFGRTPWALRAVSATVGSLTVFGIFLVTTELFGHRGNKRKRSAATTIGLLAAFFLATSFWHLNFSRIGFRAIMLPFASTFVLYFLLKGLRTKHIWSYVMAGIFTGIGFQSYIAFRFFPFIAAIPIVGELWHYYRSPQAEYRVSGALENPPQNPSQKKWHVVSCSPCGIVLYLFITFAAALPIGVYFLQHPQDFVGRANQVSIFSTESPFSSFAAANIKTFGMFFASGDCNWRHNYACFPELVWPLAIFFAVGIIVTIRDIFKRRYEQGAIPFFLLCWLIIMSLPATLTWEGLPHALRSIGMIPPVMILAALGCWRLLRAFLDWFERKKIGFPEKIHQLIRIQKEIKILFMAALLLVPIYTYRNYFVFWTNSPNTYWAFATDLLHIGEFLRDKKPDIKAYVIVNLDGTDVRGVPMPAQTVMFVTDTFRNDAREQKKIFYVRADQLDQIHFAQGEHGIVALLNGEDRPTIAAIKKNFPELREKAPGDFVVLEN